MIGCRETSKSLQFIIGWIGWAAPAPSTAAGDFSRADRTQSTSPATTDASILISMLQRKTKLKIRAAESGVQPKPGFGAALI